MWKIGDYVQLTAKAKRLFHWQPEWATAAKLKIIGKSKDFGTNVYYLETPEGHHQMWSDYWLVYIKTKKERNLPVWW
jgi:hypothetical protein